MINFKKIFGSAFGVLAAFSIFNLGSIIYFSPLEKIATMGTLGATLILLWGKSYF